MGHIFFITSCLFPLHNSLRKKMSSLKGQNFLSGGIFFPLRIVPNWQGKHFPQCCFPCIDIYSPKKLKEDFSFDEERSSFNEENERRQNSMKREAALRYHGDEHYECKFINHLPTYSVGIWHRGNVVSTSLGRHNIATALHKRHVPAG